ncbi:hypothetical protein PFICI_11362 [Pestalotiopsis fici W106-1]|uniref:Uncharacterized protein n=1 Tax=Pestalotiopsis fici (strain W106-1 / CGMCC3.15140) TaxID=1229662 RepID=W3WUC6_PESFW|nr:uncharacterized protein PFICI_11362 [Pestalotiopsis fici W106-1]ETS77488.1 hypothetical protein PFICI_11362 [Pestalotiopsis fici W106-1]
MTSNNDVTCTKDSRRPPGTVPLERDNLRRIAVFEILESILYSRIHPLHSIIYHPKYSYGRSHPGLMTRLSYWSDWETKVLDTSPLEHAAALNSSQKANYGQNHTSLRFATSALLWVVVGTYVISFLICLGTSFRRPHGQRVFHYIFTISLLSAAIHYFTLASLFERISKLYWPNLAALGGARRDESNEMHMAESAYLFKKVTYGAMVLALGLLSGVPWAMIIYNIALAWIWIHSYLVFLTSNMWDTWPQTYLESFAWGFFAFGTIAWLILASNILGHGRESAVRLGGHRHYDFLSIWAVTTWFLWNLTIVSSIRDTGISLDVMDCFFGLAFVVADIMMTPIAAWLFCHSSHTLDHNKRAISDRVHDDGRDPEGSTVAPARGTDHQPETSTPFTLRQYFHRHPPTILS